MRVVNNGVIFCLNIIDILLLLFYFNKSQKEKPNVAFQIAWNSMYVLVATLEMGYLDIQWANVLIQFVFVMGNAFAFPGQLKRNFVYGFSYVGYYFVIEAIAGGIMLSGFKMNQGETEIFTLFRNLAIKCALVVFTYVMTYRRNWTMQQLPRNILVGLLICVTGNIITSLSLTALFRKRYPKDLPICVSFCVIGLFLIMLFTYWLFAKLCTIYRELFEQQQRQHEYEQKEVYFKELERSQEEIRKIRHDLKNQLLELDLHITSDTDCQKKPQTLSMIREMQEQLEKARANLYTTCIAVDAILRDKIGIAEQLGISVEHQIKLNGELKMKRGDMGIILGNLLDNAIEATQQTENPYISIKIIQKKEQLMMEIKNSCIQSVEEGWNSTKLEKENHGIGLRSVKHTVEQYDGRLLMKRERNVVIARVNLLSVMECGETSATFVK